jgi:hypothetical protein
MRYQNYQWMEGGVIGDLGYVIRVLDYRAGPGSVMILLLVMMDFLALVMEERKQLAKVYLFVILICISRVGTITNS